MAPTHDAVFHGDLDEVKGLIREDPALVNQRTDEPFEVGDFFLQTGSYPLHIASARNHVEVVKWLLDHGADIHTKDDYGEDALGYATYDGSFETVCLLLEREAHVDSRTNRGVTALMQACIWGHIDVTRHLLELGADIKARARDGFDALMYACQYGRVPAISLLLERGANVMESMLENGTTVLIMASSHGRVDIIRYLLDHGGRQILDASTNEGSALHASCFKGDTIITKLLLEAEADPRLTDYAGATPLGIAREGNHGDIIHLIEAALAEPERVRWLHKARLLNDAEHAISKAIGEGDGLSEVEKKQKIVAAAPACLKERVKRGEELPKVMIGTRKRDREEEEEDDDEDQPLPVVEIHNVTGKGHGHESAEEREDALAGVVEHVVMEGKMLKEIFLELMEMMVLRWDDERSRT